VQIAACALFLLPAAHVLARRRSRNRQTIVASTAFAVFGLAMMPVVGLRNPRLVELGAMGMLFLVAAYLFAISAETVTRGVVAAVAGLAAWGISYPAVALVRFHHPDANIDHFVFQMPQVLVMSGIILTLLEEHVERTERMAMHDPLTDLPNRRLFEERLIATMEEARADRTTVACLVIDVDNFKTINDTLGHSAGDQLLRALAVRLSWHMGPRDILARTGGDEFTALLAGVRDEHHLRFVAGAMMSAGSVPISIDGKPVDVRISIGIALSPDHADDIDGLRRAADMAMYSAKRRGGSMLAFADEE
jgi:diguanylate cyclase (GGDEF)-like protein